MSGTPPVFDVLVAGYGPTGATLAALLGRRGWRVAVLDRAAAIYDKPRAITADHEVLRVLQEIGIADAVHAASVPHPGTDYLGLQGQVIKRFYPAPPPEPLGWTPNWMFVQPELEAQLRGAVDALPTVQVRLAHELLGFTQDAHEVQARVRLADDGSETTLHARWLVGADGASSTVRRQLASPIEDLAFDEWWLVVDAWLRGATPLPERCVQFCRPSRPGTYIVGPGALRRWEIKMLPHERPEHFESHEAVWRVLGHFVDTGALEHCRTAVYRFHALVLRRWREGRVFLAGDAAHQMPPFLGQGLCAGVRDAHNLAWKLERVLRHGADDALLDSYETERKPHVQATTRSAIGLGRVICERDPDAARRRDERMLVDCGGVVPTTVRQSMLPALTDGLIAAGSAGAGSLFPQPWVRSAGDVAWRLLDEATGPCVRVVALEDALDAQQADALGTQLAPLQGCLVRLAGATERTAPASTRAPASLVLEERDGLMADWLRGHGAAFVIARPDHIVHATAATAEAAMARLAELATALRPTATAAHPDTP